MKILNSNIVAGVIAVFVFAGTAYPQAQKNIDLLSQMIDKSIAEISIHISNVEVPLYFNYVSPADYIIFKNRCMAALKENHFKLVTTDDDACTALNYTLNVAAIKYNETFRDGLFGDYFVEREAEIKGSFSLETGKQVIKAENFEIAQTDTVLFDEIKSLSNSSLPFTKGEAPAEPFFASLWEPVIAVGTAIVTIFLFFTIRSK